nr:uncharacterized protein LOC109160849 [Ipomoea trifida]
MGNNITEDPAFKALQKSIRSLEAYADKIENLSSTVSSLSATQHQQADALDSQHSSHTRGSSSPENNGKSILAYLMRELWSSASWMAESLSSWCTVSDSASETGVLP